MNSKTDKTVCTVEDCSEPRTKYGAKCREHKNQAQREWVKKNTESAYASAKKWRQANPEKVSEYSREYYEKNKEAMLASMKAYRERNPEQIAALHRAWREANEGHTYLENGSGYIKYIGYEHPATNASGITPYHRIVLWEKLNGQDAYCHWGCGRFLSWNKQHPFDSDALCVDHVNNVKDDNRPENLVPSCHRCNVSREGARREDARKRTGVCHLDYCDKPMSAAVDGNYVCQGHYMQHWYGKSYRPLRFKTSKAELAEQLQTGLRKCRGCEETKPLSDYYYRNGHPMSNCKACLIRKSRANYNRKVAN